MAHLLRRALPVAALLLAFGASAAHAADSITVTAGTDPTEEVPLAVTANWTSSSTTGTAVYMTVKPAGPLSCGASYSADAPNSDDVLGTGVATPSGSNSANWTFSEPGTFTLCGYLQKLSDGTALAASGPVTVTVRSATASAAISMPARVDTGKPFPLSVAVTAELRRQVFVTIKPAGGRGCEATYTLDSPNSDDVLSGNAQGVQTVSGTVTASQTPGKYLLCAYVQESSSDTAAEATTSATFLVGPDPCVTAKGVLAAATKDVHTAEKSVNANRTSYNRYHKAIRKAHGKRRVTLRTLANRAHSRYVSAVRRRATARGTLGKAQAGVKTACTPPGP
jgi:surface-anchored protein